MFATLISAIEPTGFVAKFTKVTPDKLALGVVANSTWKILFCDMVTLYVGLAVSYEVFETTNTFPVEN